MSAARMSACCLAVLLAASVYLVCTVSYVRVATKLSSLYVSRDAESAATLADHGEYAEWTALLRADWQVIHAEFKAYEREVALCQQYPDFLTNWDKKWTTIPLFNWGYAAPAAAHFPRTMALLARVQRWHWIRLAELSVLQPGKFIPRHRGVYAGQLTYQLTLETPVGTPRHDLYLAVWPATSLPLEYFAAHRAPSGVPDEVHWPAPGTDVLFDDSCVHEALNAGQQRRVVLIVNPERVDAAFKRSPLTRALHWCVSQSIPWLRALQQLVWPLLGRDVDAAMTRTRPRLDARTHKCDFAGVTQVDKLDEEAAVLARREANHTTTRLGWRAVASEHGDMLTDARQEHVRFSRRLQVFHAFLVALAVSVLAGALALDYFL